MSVERDFNETHAARLASREKQMQQNYRPVISVHKWFARRPGSLFRALALAELTDTRSDSAYAHGHRLRGVCLDPFMGGGSPIFEASRLGLSVIGYDTNPMARWVVERELEDVDPDELAAVGERVCADVEASIGRYYKTTCPDCLSDAQSRYYLWVRQHRCACGRERPLLADTLLVSAKMRRHPRDVHCCPHCLRLHATRPGKRPASCPHCAQRYAAGLVAPDTEHACECGASYRIPPQGSIETPSGRLVAVDYHCPACLGPAQRAYKTADERDHRLLANARLKAARNPSRFWPDELIPRGVETERLLRWGYNQWRDLFDPRQLHALGTLAQHIDAEPDGPVKRALQTCFSDFLRYQNMLCRYDRQALKPTDVFAVHGFPVPRVSCEVHPLGVHGTGSGGFRHALAKYVRAKRWCRNPYEVVADGGRLRRVPTTPERLDPEFVTDADRLSDGMGALLERGSLRAGDLEAESVSIVLTDPPYFANVQYAELMDFCYAWLRRLAPDTPYFDQPTAKTDDDAVGSDTAAGVDLPDFARRLAAVFSGAAHALRDDGAFIFTYHHNELAAYAPLVVACLDASLVPTRLYACPSEMRASTHIRGNNAATTDAVFVLRKRRAAATTDGTVDFASARVSDVIAGRVAALRRAGLEPSDADRACLRHAALAARAIAALADGWNPDAPIEQRTADAASALGLPAPQPAAA